MSEEVNKNPMGRPRKYQSPNEMQLAIDGYFAQNPQTPTISGLTLHLGFDDRDSLLHYEGYGDDFSRIIKNAVTRLTKFHEERCMTDGKPVGSIFWMKCHKWREEPQQHEITGKEGGPIPVSVVLSQGVQNGNRTDPQID